VANGIKGSKQRIKAQNALWGVRYINVGMVDVEGN
jgi:hypothetical protein